MVHIAHEREMVRVKWTTTYRQILQRCGLTDLALNNLLIVLFTARWMKITDSAYGVAH